MLSQCRRRWANVSPTLAQRYIPENRLNFPTTKGFRMNISMKLFYQYMAIFFNLSPNLSDPHLLQALE